MNILETIIHRASANARQCGAPVESAVLVAIQLLAWRKASESRQSRCYNTYAEGLDSAPRECFRHACQHIEALLGTPADLPEAWIHPALLTLMLELQRVNLQELTNARLLTGAISQAVHRKEARGLPQEVVSLMVALGGNLSNKSVYCPFDPSVQFTVEALSAGSNTVCSEMPVADPLPAAIKVLCNLDFEYHFSHPVYRPSFLDNDRTLHQFDVGVCSPPWGSEATMHPSDEFKRFTGDERLMEQQIVRHLLHQIRGISVVHVPLSLLFGSSKGLKTLRKDMTLAGQLRAVVGLPSGLLASTGVASAIVVIDSQGGHTETLMIDAANGAYSERDGRSRSRLVRWKQLYTDIQSALTGTTIPSGRVINHEHIQSQGFQLQVHRYLQADPANQLQAYLPGCRQGTLGDLVDILRPSLPAKENGIEAKEVSVADYPFVGRIHAATKPVVITPRRNLQDLFLKPDDIVTVVKGALSILGKVGFVGAEANNQHWVANQMSLILRVNSPDIVPSYLYLYLRSELAKEQIKNLNLGSVIPNLRPADLRNILVPLPPLDEQRRVVASFHTIEDLQHQIDSLTQTRDTLAASFWPARGEDTRHGTAR